MTAMSLHVRHSAMLVHQPPNSFNLEKAVGTTDFTDDTEEDVALERAFAGRVSARSLLPGAEAVIIRVICVLFCGFLDRMQQSERRKVHTPIFGSLFPSVQPRKFFSYSSSSSSSSSIERFRLRSRERKFSSELKRKVRNRPRSRLAPVAGGEAPPVPLLPFSPSPRQAGSTALLSIVAVSRLCVTPVILHGSSKKRRPLCQVAVCA